MTLHTVEIETTDICGNILATIIREASTHILKVNVIGKDDMTHFEKVWDTIDLSGEDVWDSIVEFEPQDFQEMYNLTENDAIVLWQVVQYRMDVTRNVTMKRPSRVGTMINESLHQSLEGWTVEQGLTIQAFLSDIAYSISQMEEDERLAKLRRDPRSPK